MGQFYLGVVTANIAFAPALPTYLNKLLPCLFIWLFRQLVVGAGQFATEKRLLAALPPYRTSSSFVLRCPVLFSRRGVQD